MVVAILVGLLLAAVLFGLAAVLEANAVTKQNDVLAKALDRERRLGDNREQKYR